MSQTQANHPFPKLHQNLVNAAKNKTLTADLFKNITGCQEVLTVESATAYVNWDTTLVIEGPYKANIWFSGASRPQDGSTLNDTDIVRDTQSNGVLFYSNELLKNKDLVYSFFIVQFADFSLVVADIASKETGIVAVYFGPITQNICSGSAVEQNFAFDGAGLWGILNVNK